MNARSRPAPDEEDDTWELHEPSPEELEALPEDVDWWVEDDETDDDPRDDVAWLPEDDD